MKKNKIKILILCSFLVVLLLNSCTKAPEFVGIKDFKITNQTDTSIVSSLFIKVRNPNSFDIQTNSLNYVAYINNVQVGQGKSLQQFTLKKNEETSFENQVEFNILKLLSVYDFIIQRDSFPLDMELFADFTKLSVDISRKYTVYINPKEIIGKLFNANLFKNLFSISKFEIKSINMKTTDLTIKAKFENKFPIDFTVDKINLEIYADDKLVDKLGSSNLAKPVTLVPNNSQIFDIDAQINNASATSNLMGKLMSGNLKMYVIGDLEITVKDQKYNFPYANWVSL